MRYQRWPNNLGADVFDDRGNEVGEVWETLPAGKLGVRTFKANGEADKWMEIDPSEHLFMNPADAVLLCLQNGNPIN